MGAVYTDTEDDMTAEDIASFFAHIGQRVAVSRIAKLDYHLRTAEVSYRVFMGPPMKAKRAGPPFGDLCKRNMTVLNLLGVDDRVPLPLLEQLTETNFLTCFSEAAIARDTEKLRKSGLFEEVGYSVVGKQDVKVSLQARGKPLKVSAVQVRGFGLLGGTPYPLDSPLPLKAGDFYSRTRASQSLDYLVQYFARNGWKITGAEAEELADRGVLKVYFDLLAAEEDQLFINGQRISTGPKLPTVVRGPHAFQGKP
jgi:hypothetical protein